MFIPKTPRIQELTEREDLKALVEKVDGLFVGKINVYIDFANVRPWSEKLGWHISPNRLKQFLKSFDGMNSIKWYQGGLIGDSRSKNEIKKLERCKYEIRTKPVKIMKLPIDVSSISLQSPDLLKKVVRKALLRKYNIETIEFLNNKFKEMNAQGIYFIGDRKCNFDVEIGTDMRVDDLRDDVGTFVLWSGDSDFADPIKSLMLNNKKVVLFATAGRVSREINALVKVGLFIFDIFELRDFICWKGEEKAQEVPKSTKDPISEAL
jgi:uncharacterized LabA/DUF88 family protein